MEGYDDGFWVGPTLFDHVTKDMKIYQEEIFGPVLSILRAADYDEALRLCSEHEFGNGVAIFTRDGDAARDFASRVAYDFVVSPVAKPGIVKAWMSLRARPSRSIALAATISACVESSPPLTPITTLGWPIACSRCSRPDTWML